MVKPPVSGRYLSFEERVEIADARHAGRSIRSIAAFLGRAPSTISRELRRNGSRGQYGPHRAQKRADKRACRPRALKLENEELAGVVRSKLKLNWSPEQISLQLSAEHPDRSEMRVAHETIYQSVFRQTPAMTGMHSHLRRGHKIRKPRGRAAKRAPQIVGMTLIKDRPTEIESRNTPGHWEGDLIVGTNCRSSIATLVERQSRFLVMVALPNGHKAAEVRDALVPVFNALPPTLRRSLTWDQGTELARHKDIAAAARLDVYFCDPHSPWQRGSNENTNGLIRQYFPKGTDLSIHDQQRLTIVAAELNNRPRKVLAMRSPVQVFDQLAMH